MRQLLMKETDPVARVLKINLGVRSDFHHHIAQLEHNPRSIVIPGVLRHNLVGSLDLARDSEKRCQVVDGVPCKPLMNTWKKQAAKSFRPRSLSFFLC